MQKWNWSKKQKVAAAKDGKGIDRYWVWTHPVPNFVRFHCLDIRRDKFPTWHAFENEQDAKQWAEEIDSYTSTVDEVGSGQPPKAVVECCGYEKHY